MTTIFEGSSAAEARVNVCTDALVQLFPKIPLSSIRLSPMSLSKAHDSGLDDDGEDPIQVFRSSPASTRTPTKESPSSGSSELPSILSEKGSSRECSGDGSTGCFPPSEVTDTERSSISEGSLSPQRFGISNGILSPTIRLDDAVDPSADDEVCISRSITKTSVSLVDVSSLCDTSGLQPARPGALITETTCSAFTPSFNHSPCATVSSCDPNVNRSHDSCKREDSVHHCALDTPTSISHTVSDSGVNRNSTFHLFDSHPISGSDYRAKHVSFQLSDQNHSLISSESTLFSYPTHLSPGQHINFFKLASCSKASSVTRPLANRLQDSMSCSPFRVFSNCDSATSSMTCCDSPSCSTTLSFSTCHSLSSDCPSVNTSLIQPTFSLVNHANSRHSDLSGHIKSATTRASRGYPEKCFSGRRPLSPIYSESQSCRQLHPFDPVVRYGKRCSPVKSSVRSTKRRRLSEQGANTHPVSAILLNRFRSSDTRHLKLYEPTVSLPLVLCPPPPISPVAFNRTRASVTCDKSDIHLPNVHHCNLIHGKYVKFPFNVRTTTPKSGESELLNFLIPPTSKNLKSYLDDNMLTNSVRSATLRYNQSHLNSSPPSPMSVQDGNLLDFLTTSSKCDAGRTTPPLPYGHNPQQLCGILHSSRRSVVRPRATESVIPSGSLFSSRPLVCAECSMQIIDAQHVLKLKLPEIDEHLIFCSAYCMAFCQNNKLSTSKLRSFVCEDSVYTRKSLLTDPVVPSVLLSKHLSARTSKLLYKKPRCRDKVRQKKMMQLSCHSLPRWSHLHGAWRSCPHNWQRFSRDRVIKGLRSTPIVANEPQLFFSADSFTSAIRFRNSNTSSITGKSTEITNSVYDDTRTCLLCHSRGDAPDQIAGRLLQYDLNVWLHLNCILWCYDTYETVSGSLVDVSRALQKAEQTFCSHCNLTGAGLPCFSPECELVYHLPCAYSVGCFFYSDRSMFCPTHCDEQIGTLRLTSLAAPRRVFISRDESTQFAKAIQRDDLMSDPFLKRINVTFSVRLRVGGLVLHSVGQLLPEQLASGSFHCSQFIYPVGYCSTRFYWSYRCIRQRCQYHCRIEDGTLMSSHNGEDGTSTRMQAKFVVAVEEFGEPVEVFEHFSCNGVWQQILTRINQARRSSGSHCLRIMQKQLRGEAFYGLTEPHVIRAIESLPGVDRLHNYVFKFGRLQLIQEMPLAINPTGCARSEPKLRTHVRRRACDVGVSSQHTTPVHNTICSHNLQLPVRSSLGSPTYVSGVFCGPSKAQLYRRLRSEWRTNVLFGRSRIQGLGLYAARVIIKHTFIIEYLGELIRNEVGNRRERLYESQNRGIYMFRVDDDIIVDATMCGGPARYINHSCDPNCTAEILVVDGKRHIIIIASRDIEKGEEITYDYKFDIEEDRGDRIPCLCGSSNCRQWMN